MSHPPMASEVQRILWLRRWQVRSVAIGTLGASGLLAGAVLNWSWLFVAGAAVFAAALAAILALGAVAIWGAAKSHRVPTQATDEPSGPIESPTGSSD